MAVLQNVLNYSNLITAYCLALKKKTTWQKHLKMGKRQLTTSEAASLNHSLKLPAVCTSWWHPTWKVSSPVMCRHDVEGSHQLSLKTAQQLQSISNLWWKGSICHDQCPLIQGKECGGLTVVLHIRSKVCYKQINHHSDCMQLQT